MSKIITDPNLMLAEAEILKTLDKYNLKVDWDISFPDYDKDKLPDEVMLALRILRNHKMKIGFAIINNPSNKIIS